MKKLPDANPEAVCAIHAVAGFHVECFVECRDIGQRSVHSFLGGSMYICHQLGSQGFCPFIIHPTVSITKEIPLKRSEPADLFSFFIGFSLVKSIKSQQDTAEIGDIFSLCCIPVDMEGIHRREFIEL